MGILHQTWNNFGPVGLTQKFRLNFEYFETLKGIAEAQRLGKNVTKYETFKWLQKYSGCNF